MLFIVQNTDKYGRITSINGLLENTYKVVADDGTYNTITPEVNNSSSKLTVSKDLTNGNETRYAYENGNIKKVGVFNSSGTKVNEEELTYDAAGRITKDAFTYNSMSNSVQSDITYATEADSPTADGRVSACSYKVNGIEKAKTQNRYNDNYKRLTAKLVTMGGCTYDKGFTYSKTRISKVMDVKNGSTFHNVSYGYDAMGRMISESDSTDTSFNNTYVYDTFGRLIQENNKALDKTFVFKYNDNGNIIGCDTIAYTTENVSNDNVTETHVYDSTIKDRLVKFNNISISYDANGCPTYYNGRNYTWTNGKLTRIYCGAAQQPGSLYADCKFTYDAYGRRLSKSYTYDPNPASTSDYSYTYNTTYTYDNGGRLVREYCIEKYISGTTNTRDITYLYDESSIIGAVQTYNGTTESFYFDRNIKGDVIALYNSAGTKVASYIYDAWGNCTTKTLVSNNFSTYNPIRYRGYYYDRETGLYYLNARYYNPEWRRFISPDSTEYIDAENPNGLNLYCYCNNDPVNYADPSGNSPTKWWEWALAGVIVAGLIIGAVCTGGTLVGAALAGAALGAGMSLGTQAFGGKLNWGQFALDTGVGALTGLIGGTGITRKTATILGGIIGAGSNFASQLINLKPGENISFMQVILAGAMGAASGFIGGAGARNKAAINQGKGVQSATKQLNKVVRRIANGYRYNATTAQVAFTNSMNGLTGAIQHQMNCMFATAMISYGVSTITFSGIDVLFDANEYWFF